MMVENKAKFKVGDKVKYIPKLSGHNPNDKLTIKSVFWKKSDDLSTSMGVPFKPSWFYSFKEMDLVARESDIKK